jgi:glutamine phosphoribosylpyrophosphate amidotransferase
MADVFRVLEKLEIHQYPQEARPVGGYGAGLAVLKNGEVELHKVGKVSSSPARHLSSVVKLEETQILVGHVRMPSPQFMDKARFPETAQPYITRCRNGLIVVSVHNGYVTNYREIKQKLREDHVFESERVELVDSEVIPHWFEELLKQKKDYMEALNALYSYLEGSNAIALLQAGNGARLMHLIHKGGSTRGLHVWGNDRDEILFCSRKEPIMEEFSSILVEHGFEERTSIPYHTDESLTLTFSLDKAVHG